MRFLAVDLGEKRVGTAISDADGTLAMPYRTLLRTRDRALIAELRDIVRSEEVERLVVGEPRLLDGTRGEAARRAAALADRLGKACGIPVELVDEALTSVAAVERLQAAGVDVRRHPERIDQVAAQIILEDALDRRARDGSESER